MSIGFEGIFFVDVKMPIRPPNDDLRLCRLLCGKPPKVRKNQEAHRRVAASQRKGL